MEYSFEQIREMVRLALKATMATDAYCYVVDLYQDSVVYEVEMAKGKEQYFRCSYALVDNQVQLGEPVAVQKKIEYIPLQAASKLLAAAGDPADVIAASA